MLKLLYYYYYYILVHLTYPAIPLPLASITQRLKLQAVQNDAFKFVHKVNHTHRITARALHQKNPMIKPINQVLYWRARSTWQAIEQGQAGNTKQLEKLLKLEIVKEDLSFPSSYEAAMKCPEPPPWYTRKNK